MTPGYVYGASKPLARPAPVLAVVRADPPAPKPTEAPSTSPLPPHHARILTLIAEGGTDRDIGALHGLSLDTVKWHTARIRRVLGATNKTDAVALAIGRGLIDPRLTTPRPMRVNPSDITLLRHLADGHSMKDIRAMNPSGSNALRSRVPVVMAIFGAKTHPHLVALALHHGYLT